MRMESLTPMTACPHSTMTFPHNVAMVGSRTFLQVVTLLCRLLSIDFLAPALD